MAETSARPAGLIDQRAQLRRWVLIACCLASCAKLSEPPTWVFQPPGGGPFNVA